jgi:hypothetical protein
LNRERADTVSVSSVSVFHCARVEGKGVFFPRFFMAGSVFLCRFDLCGFPPATSVENDARASCKFIYGRFPFLIEPNIFMCGRSHKEYHHIFRYVIRISRVSKSGAVFSFCSTGGERVA